MEERRRTPRIQEESEVTITVVSGGEAVPPDKVIRNFSKDISMAGAKVQTNFYLPVDTLVMMEMNLKTVRQMITVIGKIKWIKIIYEDEAYEAGIEFVNTPGDAIRKLKDYVSWKLKYKPGKPGQ
jgi:Tfp pilus assembly protein PilZ